MSSTTTVIAFDLYGTLLSTESIAQALAKHFGDDQAKDVAALWRRYQLEYTWRLNSMGIYKSFSDCTRAALQHALAERGLGEAVSSADEEQLMHAYDALHTFPEVEAMLDALSDAPVDPYIFSNGTDKMVKASIMSSPELSPRSDRFKGVITVEDTQAFKPARKVYEHLLTKVGKEGKPEDVWLVTANPFDVVGATAAGLQAAWVDRAGTGWVDRLGDVIGGLRPTIVASGVDKVVADILSKST